MKCLMLKSISILVFTGIITHCHCCICCKEGTDIQPDDLLPIWLKKWGSREYGLEFRNDYNENDNLSIPDKVGQGDEINKKVNEFITKRIDEHMKSKLDAGQPEFEIARLDAISYKYEDKEMWLILRNLKFFNLHTYNKTTANYHQAAKNQTDGQRNDVAWTINIKSTFGASSPVSSDLLDLIPVSKEEKEPSMNQLSVEMNFKIKPKTANNGLKASGYLSMKLPGLSFSLTFVVKHIQNTLIKRLKKEIRATNRVPEFKIEYAVGNVEIKELKFDAEYKDEEDDLKTAIRYDDEDVNPGGNIEVKYYEERISTKNESSKEINYVEKEDLKKDVEKHLNEVIEQMTNKEQREDISQRICINLMSKMTWKVMKMETKLQLPNILLDILQYEKDFDPRRQVHKIKLTTAEAAEMASAVTKYATNHVGKYVNNFFRFGKNSGT